MKRKAWKLLGWLLLRPLPAATLCGGLALAVSYWLGWARGWDMFWVFIGPFTVMLVARVLDNKSVARKRARRGR